MRASPRTTRTLSRHRLSVEKTNLSTFAVANANSEKGDASKTAGARSAVSQDLPSWMLFYPRTPEPTAESPGYTIDSYYDTPKLPAIVTFASTIDAR